MDKTSALAKIKKQRKTSKRTLGAQYDNTRKCIEFYNGDTMSYTDRVQFGTANGRKKRATVQFNKVQPPVDSIVGFFAQNRMTAKYIARLGAENDQEVYSKYMNSIKDYVRDNANAAQIESDQDLDMLINGYGAVETDISYIVGNSTRDPNGEILKERIDPECVGWDPHAKARNMLDAGWAYYYKDYDLTTALDLIRGSDKEDFAPAGDEGDVGGYEYNPYGGVYDKIKSADVVEWASKNEERVRIYNHQWIEYETFYRVQNPIYLAQTPEDAIFYQARIAALVELGNEIGPDNLDAGEMFDIDPSAEILTLNEKQKRLFLQDFGPSIKPIPFTRKCFYTAVYSGDHIFSLFKSVSQQGFSMKFKTGTYNAAKKIWVGMVNALMDPAEYYNKALTELMFTISANSKGGVMVEKSAVEDVASFEEKWAKTDAVIEVEDGALQAGKIQEKGRAALPTGLESIVTLSENALVSNGVDPSFVGDLGNEQQSGILYKRRIRQVISRYAKYFDSIILYQKEDARHLADLIRVWVENNNGQYIRITGDDFADQFMMINEDSMAAEYDVTIQEAPQTSEDRQDTGMMLGNYADRLAAVGNAKAASAFYLESLQFMPVDGDVRNRLAESLGGEESIPIEQYQALQQQMQQMQSEMAQIALEKAKSEIALNQARAGSEVAKGAKTQTETEKTQAEIGKTQAETAKTLEEASQKGYENDLIKSRGADNFNINI